MAGITQWSIWSISSNNGSNNKDKKKNAGDWDNALDNNNNNSSNGLSLKIPSKAVESEGVGVGGGVGGEGNEAEESGSRERKGKGKEEGRGIWSRGRQEDRCNVNNVTATATTTTTTTGTASATDTASTTTTIATAATAATTATATATITTNITATNTRATPRLRLIPTLTNSSTSTTNSTPSTPVFTISSPLVSHSSHILSLRNETNDENGDSPTFYRESGPSLGRRPTYHSSHSAVNRPTTAVPSDHLSFLNFSDPITLHRSKSTNDLSLASPLGQCLPPIPPSLWGSRQQHACKHADTFTAGQVAALSDNQHHIFHHHHIYNHPTDHRPTIHKVETSPAVAVAPAPSLGPPLTFACKGKISPLSPEDAIASPLPCHETTFVYSSSSSSLTSPKPTPSVLFDPEAFSLSEDHDCSLSSPTHVSPVNEDFNTPPSLSDSSVVNLHQHSESQSELTAIFCDASSSSPSSSTKTAAAAVNVNLLAEFPWCAGGLEADPLASPTDTPAQRFLPPLPPPPSPSSVTPQSGKGLSSGLVIPTLKLEQFFSDPAMPKLRSSDSSASSRPISTGASGVPKAPSSPHSISRMFSTKIRGLLHSRDRRASSPLSPATVASSIHEAQLVDSPKLVSASVPSSPRTAHPPPPPTTVHPGQLVAAPTEDFGYGTIPISGPNQYAQKDYPPSVAEPASGHSSYRSADSPTTTTETTQDSSTSTESTGIRSNRSSFRSFEDEKRRSESPASPITPDGDYQFARTSPDKTDSLDYYHSFEDAQDDARSQEVFVYLDDSSVGPNSGIPSVQVEAPTPTVNKHFSTTSPSRIPRPVSRSRSESPATRRAPSFVASIREETTGRETPSFLAPRPAPIPIPSAGSAKPALHPSEAGPKLLRMSTMSSRSSAVNKAKAPLSLTPRVRSNSVARPSTANRPGTSFSAMSMASNRSMHSPKSPGLPMDNLGDVDENMTLPPPHSPCASTFNPEKFSSGGPSRGKPSSLLHEIVIPPPPFDTRSFRTAPASPTAPSEYSFTTGLSPKRIPDDMQMRPIVFNTEASDADVSIPVFFPVPSPISPVVAEPRRSKTVSLRHAFTRLNSHVNKRGTNSHITPDIISRPSSAIKYGAHPLSAEVPQTIQEDSSENTPTTRPRATSGATLPSSTSSFSRWKSGHNRSSSNPSNPPPAPALPAVPTTATTDVQAVALTDEERSEIARMPGTIFLKTAIARTGDGADGELIIQEHRLKPRKGMQGSGDAGKCRFCRRGPFPNMWVCLDSCGFVMCRVCANESVQGGEAELF